jgi:hypothetical protein
MYLTMLAKLTLKVTKKAPLQLEHMEELEVMIAGPTNTVCADTSWDEKLGKKKERKRKR